MRRFESITLDTDAAAKRYLKTETVQVVFAVVSGHLQSREGPNHYEVGDALITGSTGDRWSVTRQRFEMKYAPRKPLVMGDAGAYCARPVVVLAKQIAEAFSIPRCAGGDALQGVAGDWVLQYAPGDFGVVEAARFAKVYRLVAS